MDSLFIPTVLGDPADVSSPDPQTRELVRVTVSPTGIERVEPKDAVTTAPTIRYYEQIGLLRQAARQPGGQRVDSRDDVERLTFIRRCRDFDFSIEQIRTLVSILGDPNSSCMAARDMAAERLTAVRAKMRELKALERSLIAVVECCDTSCA